MQKSLVETGSGVGEMSGNGLRGIVSDLGFSDLLSKARCYENEQEKNSRILFYHEYTRILENNQNSVVYFDMSSFCSDNFQKKIWSRKGHPAIFSSQYRYSKIHVIALIGSRSIPFVKWFVGVWQIPSDLTFCLQTTARIPKNLLKSEETLIVIVDDSSLNTSSSWRKYAVLNRIVVLYTAHQSCFFNNIVLALQIPQKTAESFNLLQQLSSLASNLWESSKTDS